MHSEKMPPWVRSLFVEAVSLHLDGFAQKAIRNRLRRMGWNTAADEAARRQSELLKKRRKERYDTGHR